jgi:curved DNA-binding protein CbpA
VRSGVEKTGAFGIGSLVQHEGRETTHAMSDETKATAEGTFQKTPFANVLLYARERRMTGTLRVRIQPEDPAMAESLDVAGDSHIILENGLIIAASLPRTTETLAWVLRDLELINDEVFVSAQEALARPGTDEIATLLRLRACSPVALDRGLREHARRKVLALFGFPYGSYAYFAKVDLLNGKDRLRTPEDVLPIVWRGFMQHPPEDAAVAGVIDKLGGRALRLRQPNDFDRFEFGAELGLAPTQLRTAPSGLAQLMGLAPDPLLVRAMIYLLALTKQVEVVSLSSSGVESAVSAGTLTSMAPPAPAMGKMSAPPPVPSTSSPSVPAVKEPDVDLEKDPRMKEARALQKKMENQTYFEMFDLPDTATTEEIRVAFPKIAAKWHPDRAPAPEFQDVYIEIFALYNTASSTLLDPRQRAQYEESLHGGGGTPAAQKKVAAVLDTVQDGHKAEIAFRRKDYAEAEKLLRRVIATNPDDTAALTMLAQYLLESNPQVNSDEVQQICAQIMQATEDNDRAIVMMGLALKAKSDLVRARKCFKRALEINPNNVEASRELRLAETRLLQRKEERAAQQSPITGFFNKLLKK